jgi:type IV secretory pathway VirB10-like protein
VPAPNPDVPQVKDKRPSIAGLLPRNTQALVLGGLAVLMVLVMLFSGQKPQKVLTRPNPSAAVIDPSQARIQEYRQKLEEQTRQLALEEAQLTRSKETLGERLNADTGVSAPSRLANAAEPARAVEYRPAVERTDLEIDRAKREYQSLFASNVALSYRAPVVPVSESAASADDQRSSADQSSASDRSRVIAGHGKEHVLYEGTILETVLTNRLDSTFSGPVNGMVTTNVYSPDGPTLVIPQGTRILGEVKKLESLGQQRLAVVFHRLIRPDGSSVNLDQFQGLSQIGETGLRDQVNHHYLEIFGASLAIGAIAGLAQANTRYGTTESSADAYEQGVSASLSQSSLHILDRYLNVLPTFTIREGQRIKVYLSQDLRLPAYDGHSAAGE